MKISGILLLVLCVAASTARGQSPEMAPARSRTTPVAVGETAPDFTLTAHDGRRVVLSQTLATGPVVLVFYRGSWCPFCVRQLRELRALPRPGENLNLFAISVDDTATSGKLAMAIAANGTGGTAFPLLSDPGHRTIDAYGLHDPAYDRDEFDGIPRASVYVIGRDGRVAWASISEDYKKRPSNAEIRKALDSVSSH